MIRGFDVSETSGFLDDVFWQSAVDQGMKFVYVRCSWGNGHEDSQFRYNVQKAHEYGLKVGAYTMITLCSPDRLRPMRGNARRLSPMPGSS